MNGDCNLFFGLKLVTRRKSSKVNDVKLSDIVAAHVISNLPVGDK